MKSRTNNPLRSTKAEVRRIERAFSEAVLGGVVPRITYSWDEQDKFELRQDGATIASIDLDDLENQVDRAHAEILKTLCCAVTQLVYQLAAAEQVATAEIHGAEQRDKGTKASTATRRARLEWSTEWLDAAHAAHPGLGAERLRQEAIRMARMNGHAKPPTPGEQITLSRAKAYLKARKQPAT